MGVVGGCRQIAEAGMLMAEHALLDRAVLLQLNALYSLLPSLIHFGLKRLLLCASC